MRVIVLDAVGESAPKSFHWLIGGMITELVLGIKSISAFVTRFIFGNFVNNFILIQCGKI